MPEIIRLGVGISGMDPEFKAIKEAPPACWCGRDMVKRVRHGGQVVLACRGCGKSPQNCQCLKRGSTYLESEAPPTTLEAGGPRS